MTNRFAHVRQRGMSLIELMVGITIGLIVVAGAALVVSGQLSENRKLLVETQLQQDLRASSDIIARELRRTGALKDLGVLRGVWRPGMDKTNQNVFAAELTPGTSTQSTVMYRYQPTTGSDATLGFKLEGQTIMQQRAGSGWQELTDPNVIRVTAFSITPVNSSGTQLPCPKLCTDGSSDCWPKVYVRELLITISAEAKDFIGVQRTIVSRVRLRNDYVKFSDPSGDWVCPQ